MVIILTDEAWAASEEAANYCQAGLTRLCLTLKPGPTCKLHYAPRVRARTHANGGTRAHTHTHTHTHTNTNTNTHTHNKNKNTHTHARTHARTHTHTHARTHAHTHTHTHTHRVFSILCLLKVPAMFCSVQFLLFRHRL